MNNPMTSSNVYEFNASSRRGNAYYSAQASGIVALCIPGQHSHPIAESVAAINRMLNAFAKPSGVSTKPAGSAVIFTDDMRVDETDDLAVACQVAGAYFDEYLLDSKGEIDHEWLDSLRQVGMQIESHCGMSSYGPEDSDVASVISLTFADAARGSVHVVLTFVGAARVAMVLTAGSIYIG